MLSMNGILHIKGVLCRLPFRNPLDEVDREEA